MARANDFVEAVAPYFTAEHGDDIAYTPQDGAARTISAIIIGESIQRFFTSGSRALDADAVELMIRSDTDTLGVQNPKETGRDGAGDTFNWNSKTWYVHKVLDWDTGGFHRLLASTTATPIDWQ